jgi:hypothetical protein
LCEILLALILFYPLDLILCFELDLFKGLLTECDYILLIFLLLTTIYLFNFFSFKGGLGGTTDWLLGWGCLLLLTIGLSTEVRLLVFIAILFFISYIGLPIYGIPIFNFNPVVGFVYNLLLLFNLLLIIFFWGDLD